VIGVGGGGVVVGGGEGSLQFFNAPSKRLFLSTGTRVSGCEDDL
jgi:hypothetical protein